MNATYRAVNISIFGTSERPDVDSTTAVSILVVDDETFVAHAAAALLRAEGYCAEVAHCGRHALERLRGAGPLLNLVILDIAMPDMDGIEVLRQIRAEPSLSSVAVIMYSAFCDSRYREESRLLGAAGYVVKSGNWPELLQQVNRAVSAAA